jgi:hypothetical protein
MTFDPAWSAVAMSDPTRAHRFSVIRQRLDAEPSEVSFAGVAKPTHQLLRPNYMMGIEAQPLGAFPFRSIKGRSCRIKK